MSWAYLVWTCHRHACARAAPWRATPQGPELHLNVSGQPEPVLLLDLSTLQSTEACATPLPNLYTAQEVTKRCRRLYWLTNSALVYEPKCGGGRGGGCWVSAYEYRARICRTGPAGYIGWRNRFLGSINVHKYGLCCTHGAQSPSKLWRYNSIFNLWYYITGPRDLSCIWKYLYRSAFLNKHLLENSFSINIAQNIFFFINTLKLSLWHFSKSITSLYLALLYFEKPSLR